MHLAERAHRRTFPARRAMSSTQPPASLCRYGALRFLVAILGALGSPGRAFAQVRWSFELFAGSAHSFPTHLTVRQTGEPELSLTARYATRPWSQAPYYAYRIGRWGRRGAWEIGLIHHKLYLTNAPAEIERFEVSHGYNLLCVGRALPWRGFILRVGAGAVIAFPETTIRGRLNEGTGGLLGSGYHLAGPTAALGVGRRLTVSRRLFLSLEADLTASRAKIPVQGGEAVTPNLAAHGLAGLGLRL